MSTTWTAGHVAALEEAIAQGLRRVTHKDYTAEFHSLDEMLQLLDRMRASVYPASAGSGQVIYAGRVC